MIYRYIYKITCTAGSFKNKFYFGQHTTENLDDGYKGGGTLIRRYYRKYPNDYIKEIISFHNSLEELNQAEYDIIHTWLNNDMCLNLMEGGGSTGSPSEKTKKILSEQKLGKPRTTPIWNKGLKGYNKGHTHSEETKRKLSEIAKKRTKYAMQGKQHSEETKNILREKAIEQFSTHTYIWINNDVSSTRIDISNLDYYLKLGYKRGRGTTYSRK